MASSSQGSQGGPSGWVKYYLDPPYDHHTEAYTPGMELWKEWLITIHNPRNEDCIVVETDTLIIYDIRLHPDELKIMNKGRIIVCVKT